MINSLVSPQWLFKRLRNTNTVVFDASLFPVGKLPKVDVKDKYLEKHIPGALFFNIEELSDDTTELPHMLPTTDKFSHAMSCMGVSHDMDVVIYEQESIFSAPRAWWMLRSFGVKNVYVLNGGLKAWVNEGYLTEHGVVSRAKNQFNAKLDANTVKNFEEIQKIISVGGQIVDARSAGRFSGNMPEPRQGLSSGHIPGAINIPYGELLNDGGMKSADELRALFAKMGIDLNRPITTMCGSGVTAAVLLLGLELAGAKSLSLYDGSWAEYASRPEAIIKKTK